MVKVRIKCRTENQLIPGGYLLPRGESICLVYAPDLPTIEKMVEPNPAAIAQASQFFAVEVEDSIRDELQAISDDEVRASRLAKAREEYSGSMEAKFKDLYKRDLLPLESVEVMERDIPAPVQQQQVEQQSFLATTIAKEVTAGLAAALPQVMAALAKELTAQTKSSK
jgi:hypothetical protein